MNSLQQVQANGNPVSMSNWCLYSAAIFTAISNHKKLLCDLLFESRLTVFFNGTSLVLENCNFLGYTASLLNESCALAALGGTRHLTFVPWQEENLSLFLRNYTLGTLDFTVSEHWATFNVS